MEGRRYLVQAGSLAVGRGSRVRVTKEGLNGGEDGRYVVDGAPLILQYIYRERRGRDTIYVHIIIHICMCSDAG